MDEKDEKITYELKVDEQRLSDLVTLDQIIGMQEGNVRDMRDVMGLFVVNGDGQYLEEEEGKKVIGSLTLTRLNELMTEFNKLAENAAVPFGKGKTSVSLSKQVQKRRRAG